MDTSEAKKPGCLKRGGQFFLMLLGLIALAIFIRGFNSTPEERQQEEQQRVRNAAAMDQAAWAHANRSLGESAVIKILRDPDSAQFRDVTVVVPEKYDPKRLGVICGDVNAKNAFGGYTGFKKFVVIAGVPMIEDGRSRFARL